MYVVSVPHIPSELHVFPLKNFNDDIKRESHVSRIYEIFPVKKRCLWISFGLCSRSGDYKTNQSTLSCFSLMLLHFCKDLWMSSSECYVLEYMYTLKKANFASRWYFTSVQHTDKLSISFKVKNVFPSC